MKEFRIPGAVITTKLGLRFCCEHGFSYSVMGEYGVHSISNQRARQLAVTLSLPDGREFVKEGQTWSSRE